LVADRALERLAEVGVEVAEPTTLDVSRGPDAG
jgi:hypothetical protein